ncbi:MAG TPA: ABC transporter ATP-binding protein [Actinomycetota bacterium]|nr:ABC transporter ATP-binding protein [Actinomycetota bacterium]
MSTTNTVELENLSKRFGRKTIALDGLSLSAGPGVTGILGPNGAGKTTLLRILATVLPPDSGRVRVLGHDITEGTGREAVRRTLGFMPQNPGFHQSFTAFEFVDYVAILKEITSRRERHEEVDRVLELVGLSGEASKKIRNLSGGMRRRVALAQALLGDPRVIVLDEPTVALDPEQRLRSRELLSRLGDDRVIFLSTHQTEDVAALCQRVFVVDRGTCLFSGTPSDLADVGRGKVWLAAEPDPRARTWWRTGEGMIRNIGDAPSGAQNVAPTVEDGYLLLVGQDGRSEAA